MTGSDTIVAYILEDARKKREARLAEAEQQAEAIIQRAQQEADVQREMVLRDGEKQEEYILRAARSAAALYERNALLRQKRRELDQTLEDVRTYWNTQPDDIYFTQMYGLLSRNLQPGPGILRMNERDSERLPVDFSEQIRDLLKQQGIDGSVTLSGIPIDIDGGFLLQYGDIEIDASFSSLLEEKRAELEDYIRDHLFVQE